MTDQRLVDELERAFTDEVYDGGMGALSPEQLRDHVRGLAVTAAGVLGELLSTTQTVNVLREDWDRLKRLEAHTPTDDEREALARVVGMILGESDDMQAMSDDAFDNIQDSIVAAVLADGFHRSEVPEPSAVLAERERAALHAEEGYRLGEHCDDIAKRIRSGEPATIAARPGPQGEPSDAQVADIEQRVYDENKNQIAGMAKALVRAGWDAALRAAGGVR